MDPFKNYSFDTPEELLQAIKDKADDISEVTISIARGMLMIGPKGDTIFFNGAAGNVKNVDGDSILVSTEAMENLLNDGLLNRLRIKIRLLPLEATGSPSSQGEDK